VNVHPFPTPPEVPIVCGLCGLEGCDDPLHVPPPPGTFFDSKVGLLAQTLVAAVEERVRFAVDDSGRLYRYRDGVWCADGADAVRRVTAFLLGNRYRLAHGATAAELVRIREPFFTDATLDTQYLNLPNGLLDWRTATLQPHRPEVPSAIRFPVPWNAAATCPVIDAWLDAVLPFDGGRDFAHEVIGYGLLNDNPLHRCAALYGSGRNGKGTFLRLLRALAGDANCAAVSPQSLDENRFRSAELWGKALNLIGDVDPRTFRATETFKQATGGDVLMAERKHGHPFQFLCRALLVAGFNALPRTADTSEGFFSRWIVVPFTQYFPPGVADVTLKDRLTTPSELQGLLVQAVAGLQRVMERRDFLLPEAVQAATTQYRQTADTVRLFATDQLTTAASDAFAPRTPIYKRYRGWAEANGYKPISAGSFYDQLDACAAATLGAPLVSHMRNGVRGFLGIDLCEP